MAKPQIRVIVSQAELDQVRGQACAEGVSISSLARVRLGLPPNPTPGGYRGGGRPKGSRNKPKDYERIPPNHPDSARPIACDSADHNSTDGCSNPSCWKNRSTP